MTSTRPEITEWIRLAGEGNRQAETLLIASVYPQLRGLAGRLMRAERQSHTLQPTALVNEVYLKLFGQEPVPINDRAHFIAVAAQQMRRILASHGRRHRAAKRGGGLKVVFDEAVMAAGMPPAGDIALVEELLGLLQKVAPLAARVTELKFYGGMTDEEVAVVLGTNHTHVRREWTFARNWMRSRLKN